MSSFSILQALNSAPLYLICGGIIAFVAVICVIFLIRAYRAGIAMGMDKGKMKTVITSSATFSKRWNSAWGNSPFWKPWHTMAMA